jgi:hypothetical protein
MRVNRDLLRVARVIVSCVSTEQLSTAAELICNYQKMYKGGHRCCTLWRIYNDKYKELGGKIISCHE